MGGGCPRRDCFGCGRGQIATDCQRGIHSAKRSLEKGRTVEAEGGPGNRSLVPASTPSPDPRKGPITRFGQARGIELRIELGGEEMGRPDSRPWNHHRQRQAGGIFES
jgi:hypothetical protein